MTVQFLERARNQCAMILNDHLECCGKPVVGKSSWCKDCISIVFMDTSARKTLLGESIAMWKRPRAVTPKLGVVAEERVLDLVDQLAVVSSA